MTGAGTHHTARVGVLIVASILCVAAVWALIRWPDIEFELGYAYENGNVHDWAPGFAPDYPKAAYWLGKAAQANHPRAQYRLGILYAHGWGVPRDLIQAVA